MCSKTTISGRQKAPKPLVRILYKLIIANEILTAKVEFPSTSTQPRSSGRPSGPFPGPGPQKSLRHGPGGPSFWTDAHRAFTLQIVMENDHYTRRDHDWGGQNWPGLRSFLRSRSRQTPCPQATFGRKKAAPPRKRAFEIHRFQRPRTSANFAYDAGSRIGPTFHARIPRMT